jgi:peptide/nickel transport system substrate-binding protein
LGLSLATTLLVSGCARRTDAPDGVLRIAFTYDLASLDPHVENSFETFEQVSNIYDALVTLDPHLRLLPALAVSWSSPDATTWSFRLRAGVRFHDGSPLTPEDVVYSVRRLLRDQSLRMRSQISEVSIATAERGEVVLRTGRPSARLVNDLSQVMIVRAGATREGLEAHPNGTGPYAVESWTPRRRLVLRRHEGYWGPRPRFEHVEVEMGSDEQATASLREGRLSMVRTTYPDTERMAPQESRYRIVRQPSLYLLHLGSNVSSPTLPGSANLPNPFRRLDVRKAIDLALDREKIAKAASPYAVPTTHVVPRAVFGCDPEAPATTRDVAQARRLLETAGYPTGFDVALHVVGVKARPALPELRAQLAEIGIRLRFVESTSLTGFFATLRRRELGLWLIGDAATTGEAGWLLATQFHSPDPGRSLGTDNYGGYADADLDRTIEEADAILEPRQRLPLLQKAVRRVEDERWWIPLYHNTVSFIVDRALAFEPRADLCIRYAEIGSSSGSPP